MSTTSLKRAEDEFNAERFAEHFAIAVASALAKEALIYNMDDALESLKRLWEAGVLQKYVDKVPELQELIRLGKLP